MTTIEVEKGSGNVYADLGTADAGAMLIKAQLATRIGQIIDEREWTHEHAASVIGIPRPKLSNVLSGKFRGISETKMLECLARLGSHVQIVVGPAKCEEGEEGRIDVVLA